MADPEQQFLEHLDMLKRPVFVAKPGRGDREWIHPGGWSTLDASGNWDRIEQFVDGDALCVVLGGPVTVVDVDTKNGASIDAVRQLLAGLGVAVFAEVTTPSGGKHFYVAGHPDLPTVHAKQDRDGLRGYPGVEILAGGTNVFLPGTIRPKYNGAGYVIVLDNLAALVDGGDPDGADALAGWVAEHRVAQAETFTPTTPWDGAAPDARQQAYLDRALANTVQRISAMGPNSGRNQALYEGGLWCGNFIAGAGLDERFAIDTLMQAARACGLVDEDGEASCLTSIRSGIRNGRVRPRAVPEPRESSTTVDLAPVTQRDTPELEAPELSTDEPSRFAIRLLSRSALDSLPDPEPLIEGVLDQGTTALLYGKWGSGKSFIALDWAASVATERRWQGRTTQRRKVLYVAAEGAFGLKGRIQAWEAGWKATVADGQLDILPIPVNLTKWTDVHDLAGLIRERGYGFVVLDTLARCMVGADENSAKDTGVVVDHLNTLREATPDGRGVILGVHHTGKDGKTLRGSSAFEGGVDTVYQTCLDGGAIDLAREKRKDGPCEDRHRLHISPVDGTNSAIVSVHRGVDNSERADRILSIMSTHFWTTGASRTDLWKVAEEAGISYGTFTRALNDLLESGELVDEGTKSRKFFRLRDAQ
ncbi:AAA family ATPase [Rhodococcus rhodochrous]|uniref:AAA family ATPase n=1 Tax=Rhodococcus rhodochrous TaxID=1829 RepID=UPI0023FA2F4B